ncbi:MAG: class I SAM-dependent methyltransferase [Azospirillaceae bacterium]|nr:class I SAM-dependent methyltransferase [Azospirillaceae bacterium]
MTLATNPSPIPCKICGRESPLFSVHDFTKSCLEANGTKLPLSGIPIYYRQCRQCGFIFTDAFDDWSKDEFSTHIYNSDYAIVDPDVTGLRPKNNAVMINGAFGKQKDAIRVLDYGGGNGDLAVALRSCGFSVETYDPFSQFSEKPSGAFNLITAFEVFEHSLSPHDLLDDISSYHPVDALVLFSTLVTEADPVNIARNSWYVAPRNGHVSIYARSSLNLLFSQHGYQWLSASGDTHIHIAFMRLPAFASHLFA